MIYVASSWRNHVQQAVVAALRAAGLEVYDFRHPESGHDGFHWKEIDPDWKHWSTDQFREGLQHPIASKGFQKNFEAMQQSDSCVLVLPCGRSAHLEAGWFIGQGKPVYVFSLEPCEPELMYKMATKVLGTMEELFDVFEVPN